jgi:hypothetical protein
MNRKWSRILLSLMGLFVALTVSKLAFASQVPPAPEIDPGMAISGLAVAGTGLALVWERMRRKR